MTQFTKTHGDFQPVTHLDTPAYTTGALNAATTGVAVQPQGPKLDFFTTTGTGTFTGANLLTLTQTLQQLSTIYLYQYTSSSNDTFAVGVYPAGKWTALTPHLQQQASPVLQPQPVHLSLLVQTPNSSD